MKKTFQNTLLALTFLLVSNFVMAQAPNKMSYQAVIRDNSNALVTNQIVGMQISILQGAAGGTAVYAETQTPTSNANGLVSIEIGGGTVVSGNFSTIDWANGPYFIKTETDPAGGTNYTITGTSQLLSVPYAMYAANSGSSIPGPQGPQGPAGNDGAPGSQGSIGLTGTQGPAGNDGAAGPQGPQGLTGLAGSQGPQGLIGATGPQGAAGILSSGSAAGNTPYWNGTSWVLNNSNVHNNGAGVGVGTSTPDASAKLEIASSNQGFLPPRMTSAQRDAIASPALGLIIFNTTTNCLNFYIGIVWNETCGIPIPPIGSITLLNCANSTNNSALISGAVANNVSSIIPYTGGNGGTHNGQTVSSTGVTGLTATLVAGAFVNGAGSLTYTITGTPVAAGTASFALNIGGQSCDLNLTVVLVGSLTIGQSAGGGIVAYILQVGDPGYDANVPHGLIAAPGDQPVGAQWGCNGTIISGADGTAIGTGNQNTIDIMNGCATAGIAARICGDLVLSGYSDWYLPSRDELNKLFMNIGQGAASPNTNIGGFANNFFWSSTEGPSNNAWAQNFINGGGGNLTKLNPYAIRAVRAF